ncbi:GntR family transcriptional regulator [Pseudophaeobacter leonis]|uniref:GntR family transcriptional regulator n=1 Tax=Pseudophaeobacter leonis TaxID=1144477 RepID=UPI0009F246FF|nr:GntR family transcriptional regulator [Pseudophaeobacter leonis]
MKLNSVDISKTASASSIVFEALRKAIIEGDVKEGEPLRQDEIARQFNTSRIPVREAISRLEEQGLVKTQRYKGAVVSGLSADEAEEIFDFRALIEPEVIRRAVPLMSQETLETARRSWAAFSASADPMSWGDLNRDFHATLYRASGLQYHLDLIDNAMDRVDRYLRAQLVLSNGMQRANEEHIAIWEACVDGNATRAAELTRLHISGARESLIQNINSLR